MKSFILIILTLSFMMATMRMSCSSDHHDTTNITYSGYGAGMGNNLPDNNQSTTNVVTNK